MHVHMVRSESAWQITPSLAVGGHECEYDYHLKRHAEWMQNVMGNGCGEEWQGAVLTNRKTSS